MTAVAFTAAFLALAVLAGVAVSTGRRWVLRLPLLVVTPLLALAVWFALSNQAGWPTTARPTAGSEFVAAVVRSPTPDNAGAIYLWVLPPHASAPRAHRLPYSPELERQVSKAAAAQRHGHTVGIRTLNVHSGHGQHGQPLKKNQLRFYELPPTLVQGKQS